MEANSGVEDKEGRRVWAGRTVVVDREGTDKRRAAAEWGNEVEKMLKRAAVAAHTAAVGMCRERMKAEAEAGLEKGRDQGGSSLPREDTVMRNEAARNEVAGHTGAAGVGALDTAHIGAAEGLVGAGSSRDKGLADSWDVGSLVLEA
jgi:hypothetical protein